MWTGMDFKCTENSHAEGTPSNWKFILRRKSCLGVAIQMQEVHRSSELYS